MCCNPSDRSIVSVRVGEDGEGDVYRDVVTRCERCGRRRTVRRWFGLSDRPALAVLEADRIGEFVDVA